MTKIKELILKINNASKAYYNNEEIMLDAEYDALYSELEKFEKEYGVLPNSPTQSVGFQTTFPLRKIKHLYPSLSLSKTKDKQEMLNWIGDNDCVLSWKCDGLTIVLNYNRGKLITAATRGNGEIGEDVTHNAYSFQGVPSRIPDKRNLIIRGEAIISYKIFEKINDSLSIEQQYKNPRSMAAAATRLSSFGKVASQDVTFVGFDLVNALELGFQKMSDSLKYIASLGVNIVKWKPVNNTNLLELIAVCEKDVKDISFPTDGLVITYEDLKLNKVLGTTSKYPKYSKAFKWEDLIKISTLKNIDWSVAKSGVVTPIAVFEPIELEGSIVCRACVHNISIIKEMKLGIGDHIKVYKANMIIPKVLESIEKTDNIITPALCPICKSKLKHRIGINGKSEFVYCVNEKCLAKGENNDNN